MKRIILSIFLGLLLFLNIGDAKADVSISTYDESTREFIKNFFPSQAEDGVLTDDELINMESIRISYDDIADINIRNLNFIKEISISNCSSLTEIVINSTSLEKISIEEANRVKTINLANCSNLVEFSSYGTNSLSSLALPNSLRSLTLRASNALSNYDVSSFVNLERLDLGNSWSSQNNMHYDTLNLSSLLKLKYLYLSSLGLSTIDLSNNKELLYVGLNSNKLVNLDLSQNTKLSSIDASNNKLESIILPKGEALSYLSIYSNNLSNIDLKGLVKIKEINLSNNLLSSLDLTENSYIEEVSVTGNKLSLLMLPNTGFYAKINYYYQNLSNYEWYINDVLVENSSTTNYELLGQILTLKESTDVSDEGLNLSYYNEALVDILKKQYPKETSDNFITSEEEKKITVLTIDSNLVNDLSLLYRLEYLKKVIIKNTQVSEISVSNNLEEIEIINNQNLSNFNSYSSKVKKIIIADNKNLKEFSISGDIITLDLASNTGLERVDISANSLSSLSLPLSIKKLFLTSNSSKLNNFNLSKYYNLEDINISGLKFDSLDFSNLVNLKSLSLGNAGLRVLNLSQNTKLESVGVPFNNLRELNVSKSVNLKSLNVSVNNLTKLDLSKNTKLQILGVFDNLLTTLDLSNNKDIVEVALNSNQLVNQRYTLQSVKLPNASHNSLIYLNNRNTMNGYKWYMDGVLYDNNEYRVELNGQLLYIKKITEPIVSYQANVQNNGWLSTKADGSTAGTVGSGLRLESLKVSLKNAIGGIEYRSHIQNIGWESTWRKNGEVSGTIGKGYRLEAIEMRLTNEVAKNYDIYYRTHVQNFGWLGWAKNGAASGSSGYGYRIEAIEIMIVKKGDSAPGSTANYYKEKKVAKVATFNALQVPSVSYKTQVQNIGWTKEVSDGVLSGTNGKGYRMESLQARITNSSSLGIEYQSHIENIGWESTWKKNGEVSGTIGKGLRLEAIKMRLTGDLASNYDIYYRVHVQNIGWMGWAKNGARAGSSGYGYRIEAIEIKLVKKGGASPGSTTNAFKQK